MHSIRRYDWVLHMATIALCSYFLAQAISTYIAGKLESVSDPVIETSSSAPSKATGSSEATNDDDLDAFKAIAERNIFDSSATGIAAPMESVENSSEQVGELGPAMKTSLDIKLRSTLVIGEGTDRRSSAIIIGKESKKPETYFPNDSKETKSFAPNVKLMKVIKDRIEFLNGGRLEYAELEDFAAGKKTVFASPEEAHGGDKVKEKDAPKEATEGGKIVIDQREIDEALQNLDKLMTEIRIVPNFKEGKAAGMKVLSVKPGSVISKLGIKRGDVLEKVNGQELDIKQGMDLFNQVKDMKNFGLEVMRGGRNQTLEYEIR